MPATIISNFNFPERLDDRKAERLNSFLFGISDTKKAGS
ncbi:hypothetical protein MOHU_00110 [Moorella humiferrea]|uniref:Uncharacterized protein n=1 Tax=Neomoorella humiferrea TaxID=676965 RepID=A0A2T0AYT5_9FIRM|nr:hypothetical protein MOHU_00110 [Moorella humiferrea]